MAQTRTETALEVGTGAATLAAITGAAALVLTILGLGQVMPNTMLYVATILVGAGLMIEGSALTAYFAQARDVMAEDEKTAIGGSISAELLGGVGTVVLGILALIGNSPMIVVPVAAIVAGAALLVGGSAQERGRRMVAYRGFRRSMPFAEEGRIEVQTPEQRQRQQEISEATRAAVSVASGADVLVGIGAVTLGILALLDVSPLILSLVAMLSLGVAILLGGGAIGARLAQLLYRMG